MAIKKKKKNKGAKGRAAAAKAKANAKGKPAKGKPQPRTPPWRAASPPRGRPKKQGQLHFKTAAGKEICFAYAKGRGCKEPCPQKRAHVCEKCLQQHPTADCSQ